jgi:hypothetical protein
MVTADLARRDIDPVDLKTADGGSLIRKKDLLNVARDFQIVIETFLFIRLGIDDRVVKSEGRLFGDRFEYHEVTLGEGRTHGTVAQGEQAHVLPAVEKTPA